MSCHLLLFDENVLLTMTIYATTSALTISVLLTCKLYLVFTSNKIEKSLQTARTTIWDMNPEWSQRNSYLLHFSYIFYSSPLSQSQVIPHLPLRFLISQFKNICEHIVFQHLQIIWDNGVQFPQFYIKRKILLILLVISL